MAAALNGNKTANTNVKDYRLNVNDDIHASKTAKIIKGDISHQHIT